MASPQAPPTPISKLSDMTPKLCVQNDPTRVFHFKNAYRVGSYLGQTLKDRVKGNHLGVIIDETTDLSVQSQLGVVSCNILIPCIRLHGSSVSSLMRIKASDVIFHQDLINHALKIKANAAIGSKEASIPVNRTVVIPLFIFLIAKEQALSDHIASFLVSQSGNTIFRLLYRRLTGKTGDSENQASSVLNDT
ncbi:hypothetical protein OUZ56_009414 [Daphnia magna]|uniref:DUF4371 domain-containing protein n=1 Tax=Daphnia magna TaxID=35525 RepID=A0ABR0AG31_9CRUS|nr:hypothetical protein OUZ56_009414 [Daphnia magna]